MLKIKNKYQKILTAVLFILFLTVIFFLTLTNKSNNKSDETALIKTSLSCQFARKIDGLCVPDEKEVNIWPVALMIDNHPDAWPQAGISEANLVYNALVEGGTTRLMAFFATNKKIEKIGPIRSARPYFLDWVKEIDALYGHSGGSAEALEKISNLNIKDLNEISYLGTLFFYRDNKHQPPHNLFTDSEKIQAAREYFNLATSSTPAYQTWQFEISNINFTEKINEIDIDYSAGSLFDIKYNYNTSSESYLRFQNEKPVTDANNKTQISVKNIIIQFVPEEIHLDAADRLSISNKGQGPAWIFINGGLMRGNWQKNSSEERTIFYDSNHQEIKFQPGNIWIEIVPVNRNVLIK